MPAPFPRWSNTFSRIVLALLLGGIVGTPVLLMAYMRTPWITGQFNEIVQPVEFDHRHHVRDDAIDCRYCHFSVEKTASAGMPPTEVCMNCHNQIWNNSPMLEPVRQSYFTGHPIPWIRVHNMPDHVYFNHSIHVNKGVGCETCHGRVDLMAAVYQVAPMNMQWCIDCHRAPERHIRPLSEITTMNWKPEGDALEAGRALAQEYGVRSLTHCSACHR